MTEECDHTLDPADSNLFECCEEMTRVKAPDLCSMGIIINMAEALLRTNCRLHQSPDSPAIPSVFREIKEALQARELALPVPSMLSLEEQASKSTLPVLPRPSQSSPSPFLVRGWGASLHSLLSHLCQHCTCPPRGIGLHSTGTYHSHQNPELTAGVSDRDFPPHASPKSKEIKTSACFVFNPVLSSKAEVEKSRKMSWVCFFRVDQW